MTICRTAIKARVQIRKDAAEELLFSNNSCIRVGVSMRSGTLQYLHVSEYGQACARFPEKAREIRTGALNTVQAGQVVFIEMHGGRTGGALLRPVRGGQDEAAHGRNPDAAGFQIPFLPVVAKRPSTSSTRRAWSSPTTCAATSRSWQTAQGITLTPAQQAWYVKKAETQLGDMKREYPSTPEEAFEASSRAPTTASRWRLPSCKAGSD